MYVTKENLVCQERKEISSPDLFWKLVSKRPLLDSVPEDALEALKVMIKIANKNTLKGKRPFWKKNLTANAKKWDFHENSVKKLSNKHKGETAYIVGCSPSLKKNVKELKKKKGIILTSLHSVKFLLDNGIKPDYVGLISCDHKQDDWFKKFDSTGLTLLADATVSPTILKEWKGKIYFFRSSLDAKFKITDFKDFVSCGGNVMGGLYSIANGMGCNRLVFVGMDLSNGIGPECHCPSYADSTFDPFTKDKNPIMLCDISGRGSMSLIRMYMYKIWLDHYSTLIPVEHINATEGGVLGAYVEGNLKSIKQMRLEEVN